MNAKSSLISGATAPGDAAPRGTARRLAAAAGLVAALAMVGGLILAPAAAADTASTDTTVPNPPTITSAQAAAEAEAVSAEDRRLVEIRAATSTAEKTGSAKWKSPYRLTTGSGYTLILTPRSAPYTVTDLLALAPSTFLLQSDGSYLLLENIYVERGATLALSNPGGLKLRLASNGSGFVSIVAFGGTITMAGTADARMKVTSWDPRTAAPDTDPTDGRAYIRAIGGTFTMSYTDVVDLGFWSGRTGGIGLTGTTRPTTGSTTSNAYTGGSTSNTSGKASVAKSSGSSSLGATGVTGQSAGSVNGTTPDTQFGVQGLSYVTTQIDHDTITGDAFGLFISGATGILISDTKVTASLIDGIVLHRFASQGVIQNVNASNNSGDGIVISRAAQQIQVTGSTASYNSGNGFTVNGQPISAGPSASGEPMGAYGNNTVGTSTAQGNGHYGIEVLGGLNIALNNNSIIGNQMGIVVRRGAQKVTISGNKLTQQNHEGISIRDGVQAVTINNNLIDGAATGVYVRNATADVAGNTIRNASVHGVTLIGSDAGTLVNGNVISGIGPGAIDTHRESGKVNTGGNTTSGWFNTTAMWVRIKALIRPLTIVWFCVFLLIAFTAFKGRRGRKGRGGARYALGAHPYGDQASLASSVISVERPATAIPKPRPPKPAKTSVSVPITALDTTAVIPAISGTFGRDSDDDLGRERDWELAPKW